MPAEILHGNMIIQKFLNMISMNVNNQCVNNIPEVLGILLS